jgi:hypothetical protein
MGGVAMGGPTGCTLGSTSGIIGAKPMKDCCCGRGGGAIVYGESPRTIIEAGALGWGCARAFMRLHAPIQGIPVTSGVGVKNGLGGYFGA